MLRVTLQTPNQAGGICCAWLWGVWAAWDWMGQDGSAAGGLASEQASPLPPGQPCHLSRLRLHRPLATTHQGCWAPNAPGTARPPHSGPMWSPARCPHAEPEPTQREFRTCPGEWEATRGPTGVSGAGVSSQLQGTGPPALECRWNLVLHSNELAVFRVHLACILLLLREQEAPDHWWGAQCFLLQDCAGISGPCVQRHLQVFLPLQGSRLHHPS